MGYYSDFIKTAKRGGGYMNDAIGAGLEYVPGAGAVGGIAGLISGPASEADLAKMDEHPGKSYLPGVGAYRMVRKQLATATGNKHPRWTMGTDLAGQLTAPALLALALAVPGALVGGKEGAAVGALAGLGAGQVANGIGATIGMARKRRTAAEQQAADAKHSATAALLAPGVGAYNFIRRSTGVIRDEDRRNARAEAEGKE